MNPLSATRAALTALAGGAPLSDAVQIAAKVSNGRISLEVDAVEDLAFEPKIVSVLLARAPAESLKEVGELASRALATKYHRIRLFPHPPLVIFTALLILSIGAIVRSFLVPLVIMKIDPSLVSQGQMAALGGLILGLTGFFLRRDRGRSSDIRSWTAPKVPPLTAERTLLWFAAGEAAGVAPGIVAASLYRNVQIGRAPELDSAVARVLQNAELTELMPLAGASFPGEPGSRSAARIARFAAMASPRVRDPWRWLSYLAMALVVAGACCVSMAVYAGIGQLGSQV